MSTATNWLENAFLQHVLRGTPMTQPSSLHVGAFTAAPGETGGGTEVTGGSYARQPVTFTISGTAPTQGVNTSLIAFPTATASWGTVTHFALFDAATGGNMLFYMLLADSNDFVTPLPKTIGSGDQLRIPGGFLKITAD